jgi:hypothetical protein
VTGPRTSRDACMEAGEPPDAEEAAEREAKRARARAYSAAYHKANAEKRKAAGVARRANMSDSDRLARNQAQKKWRDENKEKCRASVRRFRAKSRSTP